MEPVKKKRKKCEDNKILAVSSTIPSTNYAVELHVLYQTTSNQKNMAT